MILYNWSGPGHTLWMMLSSKCLNSMTVIYIAETGPVCVRSEWVQLPATQGACRVAVESYLCFPGREEGETESPLSREPDMGLSPRTPGSQPEPRVDTEPTEPPRRSKAKLFKKSHVLGCLAGSVGRAWDCDFGVVSSSPTLCSEMTKKNHMY